MATQTKTDTVTFRSFGELRLIRVTADERPNAQGRRVVHKPSVAVDFGARKVLRFEPGDQTLSTDMEGYAYPPQDGTVEEDAISWLRRHPSLGDRFIEERQTAPPAEGVLIEIAEAAAAGDVERLGEIYDSERDNWNREVVVSTVAGALERLAPEADPPKGD